MGRFIDAEKYPCKTCGISYCHENCKKFYEWLGGCDYDVGKVVEVLGKESYQEFCDSPKIVELKEAIEIVRNGVE